MFTPLQEEKQRKLLRVRLEMAKFLQETLRESGLQANAHIVGSDAFKEFFRKVNFMRRGPLRTACSHNLFRSVSPESRPQNRISSVSHVYSMMT